MSPCHQPSVHKRNEQGSALIIVLLLALVLTAICTTMLIASNTDHMISANNQASERAFFASKAGLNYGYHLCRNNLIAPTASGAPFDSYASAVSTPLKGAGFTGKLYTLSGVQGQVYKIISTGTYNRGSRTTELVFEVVPESLKYGYMAFNAATLHRHNTSSPGSFLIKSTIFSNNVVTLDKGLTFDGSIVSSGSVNIQSQAGYLSTVTGSVYTSDLSNDGTVNGNVRLLTSVDGTTGTPDLRNSLDNPYVWYQNRSNPSAAVSGSGTVLGATSRYVVQNGDPFNYSIFNKDGTLISNPNLNVIRYVAPPRIDYAAMKAEADKNDPTYFTNANVAVAYLASKKVIETVGGQTLRTVKVGTPTKPEFI